METKSAETEPGKVDGSSPSAAAPGSEKTFALYYQDRRGTWFLDSWGIPENEILDALRAMVRAESRYGGVNGAKFELTPKVLMDISPNEKGQR